MTRFAMLPALTLLLLATACQPIVAPPEEATNEAAGAVDQFVAAYQAVEPVPLLTQTDPDMTDEAAYTFQEEVVAALENQGYHRSGYKLGLTGEPRPFGAEEALYGRLFDFMLLEDGASISSSDFVQPMLELEIAYFFDEDIVYPVTTEELQDAVSLIAPAVELPDLIFADMENLSWLDLIATGVAPRRVIIGEPIAEETQDENDVSVVAMRDDEAIGEGVGQAVMGDQWEALRFLAERLDERGDQIKAGDVVITGAMAPMLPAAAGQYDVDYGTLGTLSFTVTE